jgi:hypothetical protein
VGISQNHQSSAKSVNGCISAWVWNDALMIFGNESVRQNQAHALCAVGAAREPPLRNHRAKPSIPRQIG